MTDILLDTNFLVYCAKQKVDYLEKIKEIVSGKTNLLVLSPVFCEIKNLSEKSKKLKNRNSAKLALKILKLHLLKKKIRIMKTDKQADRAIEEIVKKARKKIIVATADRELKRKIKRHAQILSISDLKH